MSDFEGDTGWKLLRYSNDCLAEIHTNNFYNKCGYRCEGTIVESKDKLLNLIVDHEFNIPVGENLNRGAGASFGNGVKLKNLDENNFIAKYNYDNFLLFDGGDYHVLWTKFDLNNGGTLLTGSKIHNM